MMPKMDGVDDGTIGVLLVALLVPFGQDAKDGVDDGSLPPPLPPACCLDDHLWILSKA